MKVVGFNGREYAIDYAKYIVNRNDTRKRSKGHQLARQIIREKFPMETLLEEVPLYGSQTTKNKLLYADFFLPLKQLIIEVNGEQHTKFKPFFFDSKKDFYMSQLRDRTKMDWCELNNISLVIFDYSNQDEWKNKLDEY